MPTMYDTKAEIQGNNKTDLFLIFILGWAIYTAVLSLVMTFVFFIAAIGLIFLIDSQGDSILPRSQYFSVILEHLPAIFSTTPLAGFVWAILVFDYNNKAHEPFRQPNGKLPIFRVQKAWITLHNSYEDAFSLCLRSLESLKRNEFQLLENNIDSGVLIANVKTKKDKRGENISLHLTEINNNKIEIEVSSSSNVLLKGIDVARNIKNVYEICDFFKKEVATDEIEVKLCRL